MVPEGGHSVRTCACLALERVLALRLHLDSSAKENGPLRVIPGSHLYGVLSDKEVFQMARSGKVVECLVTKGGVLAMSPLFDPLVVQGFGGFSTKDFAF